MLEWKSKGRKLMQLSVYGTTVTFVQSNCTGCVNAYGYFIHSGILWYILLMFNCNTQMILKLQASTKNLMGLFKFNTTKL